jgi:hypothetical protein
MRDSRLEHVHISTLLLRVFGIRTEPPISSQLPHMDFDGIKVSQSMAMVRIPRCSLSLISPVIF